MIRPHLIRAVGLALMLALGMASLGTAKSAMAAGAIVPLGPTERVVSDQTATQFDFAVQLAPRETGETLKIEVVSVQRDDTPLDIGGARAVLVEEDGRVPLLRLQLSAGLLQRPGSHVVTLRHWVQNGQAERIGEMGTLQFTLTVPLGGLEVTGPLRIERVITLPFVPSDWNLGGITTIPETVVIRETSRQPGVSVSVPVTHADLAAAANSDPVGHVTLKPHGPVSSGGTATATLSVEAPARVGKLEGTLRLVSDRIESGEVAVKVEVTTRVNRLWLLALILIGIIGGIIVRTRWESGKTANRARASAMRALEALRALAAEHPDDATREALQAEAKKLEAVIRDRRAKPDVLANAVTAAESERDKILAALETVSTQLQQTVAAALGAIDDPAGQIHLKLPTAQTLYDLYREAERLLNAGRVGDAKALLNTEASSRRSLRDDLGLLVKGLKDRLDRAPEWPDIAANGAPAGLVSDLGSALPENAADTAEALGSALRELDVALRRHRPVLAETRTAEILALTEKVRAKLEGLLKAPDAERLKASEDALDTAAAGAPGSPLFEDLVDAERALWGALKSGIAAADAPGAQNRADAEEGKFQEAVEQVLANQGQNIMGASGQAVAIIEGEATAPDTGLPVRNLVFSIDAQPRPSPGLQSVFTISSDWDTEISEIEVRWFVNGVPRQAKKDGAISVTAPKDATSIEIVCEVSGFRDGHVLRGLRSRHFVLAPPLLSQAETLEEEADRIEWRQTLVSGVLIAFFGYVVFHDSFTGSLATVAAAFAWGFLTDVTLDTALTLARAQKPAGK